MPLSRRVLRVTVMVAVIALSYGAGLLTGVVGSREDARGQSVVDEAADRIETTAARQVPRDELERAAVQGMLAALGDRWSSYTPSAEVASFRDVLAGRYSGVGLWVRRDDDGRLRVATVQARSPADRAGVRAEDEVLSVGGRAVSGRTVAEVVTALRGGAGTSVDLTIRRGTLEKTVRLRREQLDAGDVTVTTLASGVVRIRVAAFTRGVGREVRAAVEKAVRARAGGVVLDLRGNPGGLLDESVETASAFLSAGRVVSYERRGAARRDLDVVAPGDVRVPLAVLVDAGTASAAEIVTGALQDRNRAVVIGSRTYGKGSVQEPARLSDGSALELTVGRYFTPSGRALDGVGVEPDIEVPTGSDPEVAQRRAVEVLTGLLADTGARGHG